MKWIRSNIQSKIFQNENSIEDPLADPTKKISHDMLFKKRQLLSKDCDVSDID